MSHERQPPNVDLTDDQLRIIQQAETTMNQIIYLVGLVVIVLFVLGYFGLR